MARVGSKRNALLFIMYVTFISGTTSTKEIYIPKEPRKIAFHKCHENTLDTRLLVILSTSKIQQGSFQERHLKQYCYHPSIIFDDLNSSSNEIKSPSKNAHFNKADIYNIILADYEDTLHVLTYAQNQSYWNPRAKFVFFLQNGNPSNRVAENTLETCWEYGVLNAIVASRSKHLPSTVFEVFTFNPFKKQLSKYKLFVDNLSEEVMDESKHKLFPNKLLNLSNSTLVAFGIHAPPYLILSNSTFTGLDWNLHQLLSERMNYSLKIPRSLTFTDIFNRKADLIMFRLRRNMVRMKYYEFTEPTIVSTMNFAVPNPIPIPQWMALISPFDIYVWLFIVVVTVVIHIVSRFFVKLGSNLRRNDEHKRLFSVLSVSLQISVSHQPTSDDLRLVFISFVWISMIMYSIYQGSLIRFLTNSQYFSRIDTLYQLADSTLAIQCFPTHCPLISRSDSKYLKRMIPRLKQLDYNANSVDNALDEVAYRGTSAFIIPRIILEYMSDTTYVTTDGRPSFHIVREPVILYGGGYVVPKGSPYLPRLNVLISRVFESALNSKWENDLKFCLKLKNVYKTLESEKIKKTITLKHIKPIFFVWSVGIAMGFGVYLAEIILIKYVSTANK